MEPPRRTTYVSATIGTASTSWPTGLAGSGASTMSSVRAVGKASASTARTRAPDAMNAPITTGS